MNKIRIIDLLNKIANGEEVPKKIKYKNCIFENRCVIDYWCKETETCLDELILMQNLNDEIEIIEEENKIPEKLKWNEKSQHNIVTDNTKKTLEQLLNRSEQLKKSINEIIDILKIKENKYETSIYIRYTFWTR